MAQNTNIIMALAKLMLDTAVDRFENGAGANAKIQIYGGSQPADPDVAVTTEPLLCEVDLGTSTPLFSAAATGTGGSADSATSTASGSLTATGTAGTPATGQNATWFRGLDQGGNAVLDGSVGTADADLILSSVAITSGDQVKIQTWKIKLPNQ